MKTVIMPKLSQVLDVLGTDQAPDQAAMTSLKFVDEGRYAKIYEHPDDPEMVVRVARGYDAWFVYAESLKGGDEDQIKYGPDLYDMAHIEIEGQDYWIAVTERLKPLKEDDEVLRDTARAVGRYVNSWEYGEFDLDDEDILWEQPGLTEFLDEYCQDMTDFDVSNFMLRGDVLVVNDPSENEAPEAVARLKEIYGLEGRQTWEDVMNGTGLSGSPTR
jgi:hypothetical protein